MARSCILSCYEWVNAYAAGDYTLTNMKWCKSPENDWNTGKWVIIWAYSARVFQWIPTWQGLDGFQKSLRLCALNENSLSIERVNVLCWTIAAGYDFSQNATATKKTQHIFTMQINLRPLQIAHFQNSKSHQYNWFTNFKTDSHSSALHLIPFYGFTLAYIKFLLKYVLRKLDWFVGDWNCWVTNVSSISHFQGHTMRHGLRQQGVWVPFWTPKPLKRTPQDTQIFQCGISRKSQSQAYDWIFPHPYHSHDIA